MSWNKHPENFLFQLRKHGMQTLRSEKAQLTAEQQQLYDRRRQMKQSIKAMEDGYRLLEQLEPEQQHTRSRPNIDR